MKKPPALVVFDLYGTLVRFGIMHHPFQKILLWAREHGRQPEANDARNIMTKNMESNELLAEIGIQPPPEMLAQLSREIQEEIEALSLFDDVLPTLSKLHDMGIPVAICSNLAKPYGAAIDKLLFQFDLIRCLSYEVGAIKPEQEIYKWILDEAGVEAEHTLFVGDTRLADYDGPIKFGFKALHLVRNQPTGINVIATLNDIFGM